MAWGQKISLNLRWQYRKAWSEKYHRPIKGGVFHIVWDCVCCVCVPTHDRRRAISSVWWPPADSICVRMQQWRCTGTRSLRHGHSCKCLWGSSCRTRPRPPEQYTHSQKHTQILAVTERTRANLAWGKWGEVLLRGRVVFNNSNRKKASDETWRQKNVGQPLVEGGSDELRDGQEEAQPGKMKCFCPCIALRNMTEIFPRNTFVTRQVF